ncbi:hypothetical protein DUG79_12180 [Vibrio parahaemolyticus]|nr:hypothetical protein [Vibrio parahaemolyticus]
MLIHKTNNAKVYSLQTDLHRTSNFPLKWANAALSSEQRHPYLNHCAVNTKFKANRKCRALRICLKRFVMLVLKEIEGLNKQ